MGSEKMIYKARGSLIGLINTSLGGAILLFLAVPAIMVGKSLSGQPFYAYIFVIGILSILTFVVFYFVFLSGLKSLIASAGKKLVITNDEIIIPGKKHPMHLSRNEIVSVTEEYEYATINESSTRMNSGSITIEYQGGSVRVEPVSDLERAAFYLRYFQTANKARTKDDYEAAYKNSAAKYAKIIKGVRIAQGIVYCTIVAAVVVLVTFLSLTALGVTRAAVKMKNDHFVMKVGGNEGKKTVYFSEIESAEIIEGSSSAAFHHGKGSRGYLISSENGVVTDAFYYSFPDDTCEHFYALVTTKSGARYAFSAKTREKMEAIITQIQTGISP